MSQRDTIWPPSQVVVVGVPVVLTLLYKMYKQEGTTSSTINGEGKDDAQPQQQPHSDESSKLQIVSHRANTTPNTIQRIDIPDRGIIADMHELVPTHIYANLTLNQIAYIKSCCHKSHQIGEGSLARVYRGIFQDRDLAIKEREHRSPDTKVWVEDEVELLQGKEHININRLYAWCIEANISYLVYIYIDGCSLDDYLRGNSKGFSYSWKQSFKMIMGIPSGI
ncbi:hypothetical protein SUGI_0859280 [Cryptomeria japonica]|nr:hypothetical protein SUGI_0859280 [Cryptomeria japonica]